MMENKSQIISELKRIKSQDQDFEKIITIEPISSQYNANEEDILMEEEAIPWPADFTKEAYHGLAGEFVKLIEPYTEADPAALLMTFLTIFSCYIDKKIFMQIGTEKIYSNIYTLIVGNSSKARKGTSWNAVIELFKRLDSNFVTHRVKSGFGSGEGIIAKVSDEMYDKKTKQWIKREDQRLLLFEPEFSSILKIGSREGNILTNIIREAFDNHTIENNVKYDDSSLRSSNHHLSIVAHITAPELKKFMKEVDTKNGFYNRFLWICVRRSKLLPISPPIDDGIYNKLLLDLHDIIEWLNNINIHVITFDESVKSYWIEIYKELSNEDTDGLVADLTARAETYLLRLSLIYAVLDKSMTIKKAHIDAALAVWDRNVQSIKFLFGESKPDTIEIKILNALQNNPMTQAELYNNIFHHHIKSEILNEALQKLSAKNKINCQIIKTKGRPKKIWSLNENN
ncbi:hypothetical protein TheetDRAFT_1410 [Thermoanaerobacter ethanolicus JW 200]|uniref:DUF3987 domain-containing protein n=1 Tax=Thermoanaerobacter ethanolicus TaxID=1757 RepID=UPI000202D80D|nr:hypothetical protein TheetDRAFT_1410 [Thermoanaerobacter ethanolicus JW 200]